jgi:hypothetical protein
VKRAIFSEDGLIRHEAELVQQFRNLIEGDRELRWQLQSGTGPKQTDRVEMEFDGHRLFFQAAYELRPSRARLAILKMTQTAPLLLVTPALSDRLVAYCKEQGIAAMDLNGRAWLRGPGLMVDRGPRPGRDFRYELEPRTIFEGKSARIVRCVLTDRQRLWTQAEMLKRTRASGGLVSRIVQYLISQGYLVKAGTREFRLGDPQELVDAWATGDRPDRLRNPSRYACSIEDPLEVARQLSDLYSGKTMDSGESGEARLVHSAFEAIRPWMGPFKGSTPALLLTQGIAAALRCPTAPAASVVSAHVSYLPTPRQMDALGLRPVTDGGNVWLYLPRDEGFFLEFQMGHDLPLTTDAQICVDLLRGSHGGAEAAETLREWEGFCRV